jgi:hypothetical protein
MTGVSDEWHRHVSYGRSLLAGWVALTVATLLYCQLASVSEHRPPASVNLGLLWCVKVWGVWTAASLLFVVQRGRERLALFAAQPFWRLGLLVLLPGTAFAFEWQLGRLFDDLGWMDQEPSLTILAYKRTPLYVVACGLLLAVMERLARGERPPTERLYPRESRPEHSPAGEGFSVTVLSSAGSIIVLARDIELVRAAENYVEICLASGKQYLHRATLTSLQKPLEAEGLVRVHRSTIVNVRFLQRRLSHRRLKMRSGRIVQVSRKYCTALQEALAAVGEEPRASAAWSERSGPGSGKGGCSDQ